MSTAFLDVVRHIGISGDPPLSVRICPDYLEAVLLSTESQESKEWYGYIDLPMKPDLARNLGQALIDCANEIDLLRGEGS